MKEEGAAAEAEVDDSAEAGPSGTVADGNRRETDIRPSRLPARRRVPGSRDDARVGGAVAWDDPETRRSYAAYRLGALRWLLGGLAGIAIAIGLSVYAVVVRQRPGLGVFIVAALLLGLIAVATGSGGLLRAVRFRVGLQRAPWQRARLRVAGPHLRLVFADSDDDPDLPEPTSLDARLMATSRWRVRNVVGMRDGRVLVCPLRRGAYVLGAEGLNNLYGLHPLARTRKPDTPDRGVI